MKKCLVVDDDPTSREIIKHFIGQVPVLQLMGECDSALSALHHVQQHQVDMLFLDVDMPQLNGIDFLKSLDVPPPTIVMSGYKDYAVDAFELRVIDYLLKPISFTRFLKAINRVTGNSETPNIQPTVEAVSNDSGCMYLMIGKKTVKFNFDDILYIEAIGNYSKIYRTNNRFDLVNENLSHLIKKLPEHLFVRIHKSYIVSMLKLDVTSRSNVIIRTKEIPVGLSYRHSYIERLEKMR